MAITEIKWKLVKDTYFFDTTTCYLSENGNHLFYTGGEKQIKILIDELNELVRKGCAIWLELGEYEFGLDKLSKCPTTTWYGIHQKLYSLEPWGVIEESKKSVRKSLKEGVNDELVATSSDGKTKLYLSDERQANHGKDSHYEFTLSENGYFTEYIRCDDKNCEKVVFDWVEEFDLDISKSEISKIIKMYESKKSARKSLKESVDGKFATDEDCNMSGKGWILEGTYNFIMEFLQEWGIAPTEVKKKNGMITLYNADGNSFGYVYDDDEVNVFVVDKDTNYFWKNYKPSTKRVKVIEMEND